MSTNFDFELRIVEKEHQLLSQKGMLKKVELEEMRLERKLADYKVTKKDLSEAINVTKEEIQMLKDGKIPEIEGGEK